ncbi:MAG TPA: tetratricopeptide repeat protein [Anaerolineae bacterium]|nr:tetratricopeptide repeat protein [Anaerolineae bacterium]HQI83182.1 tetratricopeptide repeat protein [Anaerolineae bacterium]
MSEIALHQYENEINHLIEEARYVEALAHARHILRQHPRYIGAYYLLGKTMLEADQPDLAIDMFHRALNADPEHLMARIGLTLAHQRLNNLNAAIWNLERAVELNPGNQDLVDELRQLYGRRDGIEPERIPLNRAGLARLYMRGNRPGRAVEELRALLTAQPARSDLRLGLAEAYWRDDQIVQAADTCQLLLDEMPYCLKANLLLGTLWVDSGQEEGQVYLKRAQEIDLENTLANEMFGSASPLKPKDVTLERLVYQPGAIGIDEQAKWFKRLESTSVTVGVSEMAPEMGGPGARLVDITAGLEAQIEIPDWLRELDTEAEGGLSWMANVGAPTSAPARPSEAGVPDWLRADEVTAAAAGEAIPDWLTSLAPEETGPAVEETAAEVETLPDWLGELEPEAPTSEAEASLDWLQALKPAGEAEVAEIPMPEEGIPDWLRELKQPGTPLEAETEPTAEAPDWLQSLQPPTPAAEVSEPEEEEIPEWLRTITGAGETAEPLVATEEGELPDWLTSFQLEEGGEAVEIAEEQPAWSGEQQPAAEEPLPDWLTAFQPAEAQERVQEIPTAEEIPTWLTELKPAVEAAPEAEPVEADLLAWLGDIETEAEAPAAEEAALPEWLTFEEEAAPTEEAELPEWLTFEEKAAPAEEAALLVEEAPAAESFFGWETFGEEAVEVEAPPAAVEGVLDWEHLAEQVEAGVVEAPTAEGEFLSGDDALAWLESLAAGKEEELRAQAEAETQARVAEILGRKVEAEPQRVEPEPLVEEAAALAAEEGFFGWETFGEAATEPEAPSVEAPPAAVEGILDWERLAEQVEAGVVETPTAEGDLLSGDDALAWLESLAAGKEEELRAQAEAETQARVAEILGRKVEAEPQRVEPEPLVEEAAAPAAEDLFGWEALAEETAAGEELIEEAPLAKEEGLLDWESLAEELEEGVTEAPAAEGDFLSGDEALTWLESLAAGAGEELPIPAEIEFLDQKVEPEPQIVEVKSATEEAAAAEGFFGWEAFGEEIAEVETPAAAPLAEESPRLDWEGLAEQVEEIAVEAPTAEGDFLSGDDALAWLESLAAGKEEELRAQAEVEAQARVAEILGRKPEYKRAEPEPAVKEPAPVISPAETPIPAAAGDFLSGDDALAWLGSLAAGKEEELRAQAEVESQARVAEILGRKPALKPAPEPQIVEPEPVVEEVPIKETMPTAEGDLLSGEDALSWLQSLAAGKEEELRAQAEAETQARVAEILGRKAEPKPEPQAAAPEPQVVAPEPVVEELPVEEAVPTAEGDLLPGTAALTWLENLVAGKEEELRAQAEAEAQARVAEILGRKAEPEPQVVEPEPEIPTMQPAREPLAEVVQPELAAGDLNAMRDAVLQNEFDYASRLALARELWKAGETEEALTHYAYLVQAQAEMRDVIADLRQAAEERPQQAAILQTLGDAYMAEGLVDQALEFYNRAMELL